jgi:hypothetical protein
VRLLPKIFPRDSGHKKSDQKTMHDLIHMEAEIGGTLFGAVPAGRHREFFCLDRHTWIWHESWIEKGHEQVVTTRYDVRPSGVLKSLNGQSYQRLGDEEARNLLLAAQLYQQQVGYKYQSLLQTAS